MDTFQYNRSVFPDVQATRDRLITHANPLHRSRKLQFIMKKTQMGQLTSTLPNSAGSPAVGPPAQKSRCDCIPAHAHSNTRTCMQAHTIHTLPSRARQAHLAPKATTSFVLFVAPSYKLNYTSSDSQLSLSLFPAQLSNWLPGLCRAPEEVASEVSQEH